MNPRNCWRPQLAICWIACLPPKNLSRKWTKASSNLRATPSGQLRICTCLKICKSLKDLGLQLRQSHRNKKNNPSVKKRKNDRSKQRSKPLNKLTPKKRPKKKVWIWTICCSARFLRRWSSKSKKSSRNQKLLWMCARLLCCQFLPWLPRLCIPKSKS